MNPKIRVVTSRKTTWDLTPLYSNGENVGDKIRLEFEVGENGAKSFQLIDSYYDPDEGDSSEYENLGTPLTLEVVREILDILEANQ